MNSIAKTDEAAQVLSNMIQSLRIATLYVTTVLTFALAGVCFYWYQQAGEIALLYLGWVTFGTAFDFLSHILGRYLPDQRGFLKLYARINFSALCFGIPFTALAASFVIGAAVPEGLNALFAEYAFGILVFSLLFGGLFLFARYRFVDIPDTVELTLDKSNPYTRLIFLARRGFLALSLVVSLIAMYESIGTEWMVWSLMFGAVFIATVPLHILHKHIASMLAEAVTLAILAWGSWAAFVV